MNIQQKLGLAIVQLRRASGVSQEDFARKAGIDRCYMSSIENGKRQVSITLIERVASTLGISISALMAEAERYT